MWKVHIHKPRHRLSGIEDGRIRTFCFPSDSVYASVAGLWSSEKLDCPSRNLKRKTNQSQASVRLFSRFCLRLWQYSFTRSLCASDHDSCSDYVAGHFLMRPVKHLNLPQGWPYARWDEVMTMITRLVITMKRHCSCHIQPAHVKFSEYFQFYHPRVLMTTKISLLIVSKQDRVISLIPSSVAILC